MSMDLVMGFRHLDDEEKSMVLKFASPDLPAWEIENGEYCYNDEGYLVLLDTPIQ